MPVHTHFHMHTLAHTPPPPQTCSAASQELTEAPGAARPVTALIKLRPSDLVSPAEAPGWLWSGDGWPGWSVRAQQRGWGGGGRSVPGDPPLYHVPLSPLAAAQREAAQSVLPAHGEAAVLPADVPHHRPRCLPPALQRALQLRVRAPGSSSRMIPVRGRCPETDSHLAPVCGPPLPRDGRLVGGGLDHIRTRSLPSPPKQGCGAGGGAA